MNKTRIREMPPNADHENRRPVPDWKLECYLLGELPADDLDALRALERDNAGFREQTAAARAANAEILAQYPPALMAAKALADKPARGREPSWSWNWKIFSRWAIPAFACAAALIALPTRVLPPSAPIGADHDSAGGQPKFPDEKDDILVKGLTPNLEVWRKSGENIEKLAPDAVARTGDIVQLRYTVPEPCYGAIVSLDGRGVLTVHLSGGVGKAAPLTPGRPVALGSAYRLDDAPRFETFCLITAPGIFDLNAVSESLKNAERPTTGRGRAATLPDRRQITEFTLRKPDDNAGRREK